MRFNEDFLHYIWQSRLFDHNQLTTATGDKIEIIACGTNNMHSGPDFSNAKIKIGATEWAGNVELHIKASDWTLHNHQYDAAYNNVILHVVYDNDQPIYLQDGSLLPVLVLENRISAQYLDRYEQLIYASNAFPCQGQLHTVDQIAVTGQLARSLLERLIQRTAEVYKKLDELKGDWDETFYHFIARNFGFKVNAIPFELLATSLPGNLLLKHKDKPMQVEALLFGQAGFLDQPFKDAYPKQLKREYLFLKKKYKLTPVNIAGWKFMRMRPQNFPTVRLAQFSALIGTANHLFSSILMINNIPDLIGLFEHLPLNDFWKTHYHFNKTAENVSTGLGRGSIENILINTVALFLFAYGRQVDQHALVTRAIALLEYLPAEQNVITKPYALAGMDIGNAFQSQAVMQLNKYYCNAKKCLNCAIGVKILRK